ncbi:hypothetical protein ZWY2020_029582 [Hordeum vulgare]|nr:hypothetical protein ZWY2020_029582 [Hordeum vulgare]
MAAGGEAPMASAFIRSLPIPDGRCYFFCLRLSGNEEIALVDIGNDADPLGRAGVDRTSDIDGEMRIHQIQRLGNEVHHRWVDPVHPDIIKNYLIKLWELFHEKNLGKIQDKNAYDVELAKLMKEKDHLSKEYQKMVDDVSKIFDGQDGVGKVDYHKEMDAEKFEKQKEEIEMEKLRLAKDQKCILQA